ncbi:acyltransferase [Phocaeicola sp.]
MIIEIILVVFRKLFHFPRFVKILLYKKWNPIKLALLGVQLGENSLIYNQIYLLKGRNSIISIGDDFIFTSGDCHNPLCRNMKGCICAFDNASIIIGNNVGMSSPCIWAYKSIIIGNNVNIGGDVIIIDSNSHSLDFLDRRYLRLDANNREDDEVVIGDDVWVGVRCIILKGVTIGARTIIGAGSVVTKSIPADCIAAGNPCKVIKYINGK